MDATLDDVPNVASRLQNLRLTSHREDDRDATENAAGDITSTSGGNAGPSSLSSLSHSSSSRGPLRNITADIMSQTRRALNFVGDEDQPTSSTVARTDASIPNGDK